MIATSFCALVGLNLTKLNHYFNAPINTQVFFFAVQSETKIGDTAPYEETNSVSDGVFLQVPSRSEFQPCCGAPGQQC